MCHPSWARARAQDQRLREPALLRRVRDRMDREYAQPLDVEALAAASTYPPTTSAAGSGWRTANRRTRT